MRGRQTVGIFSVEFKREVVGRITSGEKTLVELSRKRDVAPGLLRNRMRLMELGAATAAAAGEEVVPISLVRGLEQQVKQLQRLVGKQAMTIEVLEAARERVLRNSETNIVHPFYGSWKVQSN